MPPVSTVILLEVLLELLLFDIEKYDNIVVTKVLFIINSIIRILAPIINNSARKKIILLINVNPNKAITIPTAIKHVLIIHVYNKAFINVSATPPIVKSL